MNNNNGKLLLQDLFIGAWVQEFLEIPHKLSAPMYVDALFKDGTIYLDFEENQGDVFEAEIKNIRGIEISPETLRLFSFEEIDHNVFAKECDTFRVIVLIHGYGQYRSIRTQIQHRDGAAQFDDNLVYIHQIQFFVFQKTRKPLVLNWK